ncbi:hypothetical protein B0H19DRAFT_1194417 [Mycena capillaripes]|nr:hypothetical protein B0H19DRAFT_1194417 [Mycena capillaripes]
MFYVIYVLAILCGTGFCLKIHTPPMGMAVANQDVPVSWTRQHDSDPTSVMFLLENLIGGGDKTPSVLSNSSDSKHTTARMKFPAVGTFRMWAVNPADHTQTYAMSEPFTVTPNNFAASGATDAINGAGDGATDDSPTSPDLPSSALSNVPPVSTTSAPEEPAPSTSTKALPLILGAAIGGGVLLLLLVGALIYVLRRRKSRVERRTTFHRNRMVKSMPPPTFAVPPLDSDVESDGEDEKPRGYGYTSRTGAGVGGGAGGGARYMEERPPAGPYPFARTA